MFLTKRKRSLTYATMEEKKWVGPARRNFEVIEGYNSMEFHPARNTVGTAQYFEKMSDVPEEMTRSRVEVEEERTQKVTYMMDQMYIEDSDESDEEVEFVDLIPVLDAENVPEKTKVQSKITSFFT